MRLSTQLELSKNLKVKGYFFLNFHPNLIIPVLTGEKLSNICLKKYSKPIFAKNVIFIGKKPVSEKVEIQHTSKSLCARIQEIKRGHIKSKLSDEDV